MSTTLLRTGTMILMALAACDAQPASRGSDGAPAAADLAHHDDRGASPPRDGAGPPPDAGGPLDGAVAGDGPADLHPSADKAVAPQVCSPAAPPAGAKAAGLTKLAFCEDFADSSGIDMKNTLKPGFSFYLKRPFGWPTTAASAVKVQGGELVLHNPDNRAQYDIASAAGTGGGKLVGFAPKGAAYFEAAVAFDPKQPVKDGFPAFWTMAAEHLFGVLSAQGKSTYKYLENDFMEWNPNWHSDPSDYMHAMHVWTQPKAHTIYPNPYSARVIDLSAVDWTKFQIVGALWKPGDRIDTYFNDQLKRQVKLADYPDMGVGNNQRFPVILGSGNFTTRWDWVRVWTK